MKILLKEHQNPANFQNMFWKLFCPLIPSLNSSSFLSPASDGFNPLCSLWGVRGRYGPALVELPKPESKPGSCQEGHPGVPWLLSCTHTPQIAQIKTNLPLFHLLGNVQTNPLLLGQMRGTFTFVIKAIAWCVSFSSEMRSLPCPTLSKHWLKRDFQPKTRDSYRQPGWEQGLKHPPLNDGSVRSMAGLGDLEVFSNVNDSMIPWSWISINWLFWSGTIWRRSYWRSWRNGEIYRGEEMATDNWKGKLHGGSSSCICLARRRGECRGSWRKDVTPEGDGEVVACSCCTEIACRAWA